MRRHPLHSHLTPHDSLVCEFLLAFSRFEFALKRLGYVRQQGTQLVVEWRRFAQETLDSPIDASALSAGKAVELLVTRPPARQKLTDGKLEWDFEESPADDEVTLKWLLEMVYRARNNLFHGGKWSPDPARDRELLEASLAVIDKCLQLRDDLYAAYSTPERV
jgi:hypothetical protein